MNVGDLVKYSNYSILGLIINTDGHCITMLQSDGITIIGADKTYLEVVSEAS